MDEISVPKKPGDACRLERFQTPQTRPGRCELSLKLSVLSRQLLIWLWQQ